MTDKIALDYAIRKEQPVYTANLWNSGVDTPRGMKHYPLRLTITKNEWDGSKYVSSPVFDEYADIPKETEKGLADAAAACKGDVFTQNGFDKSE